MKKATTKMDKLLALICAVAKAAKAGAETTYYGSGLEFNESGRPTVNICRDTQSWWRQ